MIVMIQCGCVFGPLPGDGEYLKSFDFEAFDGQGQIELTPDLGEAMRFADAVEAIAFRNRSPQCRPRRPDGLPNRPLTAANWQLSDPETLT